MQMNKQAYLVTYKSGVQETVDGPVSLFSPSKVNIAGMNNISTFLNAEDVRSVVKVQTEGGTTL